MGGTQIGIRQSRQFRRGVLSMSKSNGNGIERTLKKIKNVKKKKMSRNNIRSKFKTIVQSGDY